MYIYIRLHTYIYVSVYLNIYLQEQAAVKRPPLRFGMLAEESVKRRRRQGEGETAGGAAGGVPVKKEDGDGMEIDSDSGVCV